jgi:hypothetical protein
MPRLVSAKGDGVELPEPSLIGILPKCTSLGARCSVDCPLLSTVLVAPGSDGKYPKNGVEGFGWLVTNGFFACNSYCEFALLIHPERTELPTTHHTLPDVS